MRHGLFLGLLLAAPWLGLSLRPSPAQEAARPAEPAPEGTRGPSAMRFSRDGGTLYVVEQDEGQVEILDAASGESRAQIPTGGAQPTGLALSPDETTLMVANSYSGSVGVIDLIERKLRATLPLPGQPYDVAIAPDGTTFVSLSQLDQVAVLDPGAGKVLDRIPLGVEPRSTSAEWWQLAKLDPGHRPRALALTPDARTLVCTTMSGGVSLIDTARRKEVACVRLQAVNLRGVAISPDGRNACVTAQRPNNHLPTARAETMWGNELYTVPLAGDQSRLAARRALDDEGPGAPDPTGVVLDDDGTAFVALAGSGELAIVEPRGGIAARVRVGANPRAVARRPGSDEIWVAGYLGNQLTVVRPGQVRTVRLAAPKQPGRTLRGRFLFTSGQLAKGNRFTCNTCHVDGNTDGISWQFAHMRDGLDRRNSRNLRGGVLLTPPYRWMPKEQDFEVFVNDEVQGLMHGRRLPHGEVHALWDFVNDLPLPPNPHRAPDGSFTEAAQRGKSLFVGKAGCATCHAGPLYGGSGKRAGVGTTDQGLELDVPHLTAVYDSAPYLHDGRAESLEAVFKDHNSTHLHGKVEALTDAEMTDLLEFVREL
jgi:YVTN family beta-propeller protein